MALVPFVVDSHESENLADEAQKGSSQKAKMGGTPFLAPLGYLNVRRLAEGLEIRGIEIDPERAPLIIRMFDAHATGNTHCAL